MAMNQRSTRLLNKAPKKFRPFQLQVEKLEDRSVMAASITASLTNGILTVQGTANADNIILTQANSQISVTGVSTKFNAAQVQSIKIESLGGNDTINVQGLKVGSTNFTKQITIVNSAGSDKVTKLDGSLTTLSTSTLVLNPTSNSGGTSGGSSTPNWFDSNITDTALRALLKTDFADSKLDRKEMLDVFKLVAQDQTVSTNEFNDLKKVVSNNSLFTTVEYVGVLARDVVLGNVANKLYQGSTLGNLAANASATQLNKLVGKWFLGTDTPVAQSGSTTFVYANASGTLFGASGPQYTDVRQGVLGDCYFVGTLGEVALRSPNDIRNMFIVNGDGTYTVRFFHSGTAEYVTVNSQLPVSGGRFVFANYGGVASSTSNVLWVALAEKAYVQLNESGWIRSSSMGGGSNSYQAIAGGWFSSAVSQIANRACTTTMFGSSTGNDFDTFKAAFDAGKMIGFASKSSPTNSQIAGGHQYVVVSYNATSRTVTLFNPWGINNGSSKPGLVTLNWTDMAASFSYWDRTA